MDRLVDLHVIVKMRIHIKPRLFNGYVIAIESINVTLHGVMIFIQNTLLLN